MSDALKSQKIMPLNQTAHADTVVRGNPVTSRPDATVENTFPGLEFDHRNLEKQFLEGLLIELHSSSDTGSGAWLRDYDRTRGLPIAEQDYLDGLRVLAVGGVIPALDAPGDGVPTLQWTVRPAPNLRNPGGSAIWQIIREFEPGVAVVVLGPDITPIPMAQQGAIIEALNAGQSTSIPVPGQAAISVIFGTRSAYVVDGVIDPSMYEPGDLTRSLCSPWQYDFTDCGCWYWASNKPDMVAVDPEGPQIYNFQRLRSGEVAPEPPTHSPVVQQSLWRSGHPATTSEPPAERVPRQMNHAELINGWEVLPVVINDYETDRFEARDPETLPDSELFPDRATIIDRLVYLAGIEHALMVEYLYAYYSIDAPPTPPSNDDSAALRLYEAASTILGVAIDEMRHFRWVNEILVILGETPVVARAEQTEDKDGNGRFLEHSFALTAATLDQIDWFIDVERNSQAVDPDLASDTVDGMYTRLYLSIEKSDEIASDDKERSLHLIKLIIDEGYDHFHRFQRVRSLLPPAPDQSYLRTASDPEPLPEIHPGKALELRVDRSYEVILNLLIVVFGRGDQEHGRLLEATRIAMVDSMDVEIRALIAAGGAPLFTPPSLTEDVNLGMFTAGPSPETGMGIGLAAEAPSVDRTDAMASVIANATQPLDVLNAEAMSSDDADLRARAERSSAAMARVRAAFLAAMGSNN